MPVLSLGDLRLFDFATLGAPAAPEPANGRPGQDPTAD
jgi:hypothetical protein